MAKEADHHLGIWRAHGLQGVRCPLILTSLKSCATWWVCYVDPPERAVVFAFDEKSQIQALDRTQPGLPLKKGRAGTMTHDYKRHGTPTLFAALDVATGEVVHECLPRHRHQEFLRFLRKIERSVASELDIHVILDNYATHKHPAVRAWLDKHPRVHFHFIPTSSSWLNLVERFFSELTTRQLKRLAVTSVDQLIEAINHYIDRRNDNPTPFVWCLDRLCTIHHRQGQQSERDFGYTALAKRAEGEARPEEELDYAIRQIVSRAVASEGVVNIFAAAGLEKPDISILSEEFLAEVRGMKQRNLAVELLRKLLKGELAVRRRKNVVQARSFAEMLEQTIHRYGNRAVEAAQVIEELIQLARDMREANARGEALGLTEDELAFYDALETNDSAVHVLGDETLRDIARELVETVRNNVKIDWTLRENVRANLRRLVKRILRKHGYPPDKQ